MKKTAVYLILVACAASVQANEPSAGLVGYWAFEDEGGSVVHDTSPYQNHGSVVGVRPRWGEGAPGRGQALLFNGSVYVDIRHHEAYNLTNNITVAAWVQASDLNQIWQSIVAKGDTAWRVQRNAELPSLCFHANGLSAGWGASGTIAIDDGQWHHVAGTYNGVTMRIYVDGALDQSVRTSGAIQVNAVNVTIGDNAEWPGRLWKGAIDEVRIYNRALGAEEIAALAARPQTLPRAYLPEDLNRDGYVSLQDLAEIAANWTRCTVPGTPGCDPNTPQSVATDGAPRRASSSLLPVYMYYLERYVRGAPNPTPTDQAFAQVLNGLDEEAMEPILRALTRYRAMSYEEKHARFDGVVLQESARLYEVINMQLVRERFKNAGSAIGVMAAGTPAAPSGLTATNISSFEPVVYAIRLNWQDNSSDEDGFLIYRAWQGDLSEGDLQLLASVGPGVTTYVDTLKLPPAVTDGMFCYRVTAYKKGSVSVAGRTSDRFESPSTDPVCGYYSPGYPYTPLPDADRDGVPDAQDQCQYVSGVWPHGCPDKDRDGVPDFEDLCVPEHAEEHYTPGYQQDPARPGCPYRYSLRWMGMKILNNSKGCSDDQGRIVYNEVYGDYLDDDLREEPYLLFSATNGMTEGGMLNLCTNRWCCGERVDVKHGLDYEPDLDPAMEENSAGLTALRNHGLCVFPATDGYFAAIDDQMGLLVSVTLMERDNTMEVYPDKEEASLLGVIGSGAGVIKAAAGCTGGPLACLMSVGGALKGFLGDLFGLADEDPDPITVKDDDDAMGTEVWGITAGDAYWKTDDDGTYGFWFDAPMSLKMNQWNYNYYPIDWEVLTMQVRLYFVLHREDVPLEYIRQKYSTPQDKAQAYQQVLPWPMF